MARIRVARIRGSDCWRITMQVPGFAEGLATMAFVDGALDAVDEASVSGWGLKRTNTRRGGKRHEMSVIIRMAPEAALPRDLLFELMEGVARSCGHRLLDRPRTIQKTSQDA